MVVPPRFTRGGVPVTPDECRPGTVVQWGQYVGVVEDSSIAETAALMGGIIKPGEYIGVRSDAGHHLVAPSELEFAPRFLVGGEWQAESGEPLRGKLDSGLGAFVWVAYPPQPTEPSAADNLATMIGGKSPTYLAARQAVERACGIERESFKTALANVRQALDHIRTGCIGCSELVNEGPRTYSRDFGTDENGNCIKCGKNRTPHEPR